MGEEDEAIEQRRNRIERGRALGVLSGVESLAEFKKHWLTLRKTTEGRSLVAQWIILAVTREWITMQKFDEIWDATVKEEDAYVQSLEQFKKESEK